MGESIPALFNKSVQSFKKRPAFQYFCSQKQKWITKTFLEVSQLVTEASKGLDALNLPQEASIAILSSTRPEWVIADLAIMSHGAVSVPIYQSNLKAEVAFILRDAEVKAVFVENEDQLKKVREAQLINNALYKIIIFEKSDIDIKENELFWQDFLIKNNEAFLERRIDKNNLASIVYTSGTTGEPKGAMITHDNLLYEAHVIDQLGIVSEEDVQLIFLPFAHIFARVLEIAWVRTGHLLAFAQSPDKLIDNMGLIKPTFMAAVPRVYEKVYAQVLEKAQKESFIKKRLALWAISLSCHFDDQNILSTEKFLAKKLVLNKIKRNLTKKLGGRLRFFVSGGAPLSAQIANFFHSLDIIICEGYGLTETTAATSLNLPWALKIGTVGKAVPGTLIKIDSDGEILVKGRGVFKGFYKNKEESDKVFTKDGWFKTGDIGILDDEGFLKIIDRKKEIIVTSQGKNIAPQRVENIIKAKTPLIAHVVVIGDKRPYLVALISLEKNNALKFLGHEKDNISMLEISSDNRIWQEVKNAVTKANETLASFEQIKRFHIVSKEFLVGQELTATLKVKRKDCEERYHREIAVLYA